jgi:hypothetical protein
MSALCRCLCHCGQIRCPELQRRALIRFNERLRYGHDTPDTVFPGIPISLIQAVYAKTPTRTPIDPLRCNLVYYIADLGGDLLKEHGKFSTLLSEVPELAAAYALLKSDPELDYNECWRRGHDHGNEHDYDLYEPFAIFGRDFCSDIYVARYVVDPGKRRVRPQPCPEGHNHATPSTDRVWPYSVIRLGCWGC